MKKNEDPQFVGIYMRVNQQFEATTRIESQRDVLQAWVKLQGLEVYAEYLDIGCSGLTKPRPGLQQLLLDAEAGLLQVVAVSNIDRFTRDAGKMLGFIEEFKRQGVTFVAVTEGIDTGGWA